MVYFKDRCDAGKKLCNLLKKFKGEDVVVYALPRGGVVVAAEIAKFLGAPLELILAHKIGHPYQPEYAIGAVSESGHEILSPHELLSIDERWLANEKDRQVHEIKRKRALYLKGRKEAPSEGRIAILVDDGIATGLTMQVGIQELRDKNPKMIIATVPVAPKSTAELLKSMADDFVAVKISEDDDFLGSVGAYYQEFFQTDDSEVIELLESQLDRDVESTHALPDKLNSNIEKLIRISNDKVSIEGMLKIPLGAEGLVLFAHGSGSSRFSPRNNFVADSLYDAGLGTLLIDLLSQKEDEVYQTRFNIGLLTERLQLVVEWLIQQSETKMLSIGLFGSSTGAAAALELAAAMKGQIKAVVSRGGRPDLALPALGEVTAPTLCIVGGKDSGVIELNQEAFACLNCEKKFEIVPNASHLFEEPGCLEEVASLAKKWFKKYLSSGSAIY